MRYFAGLIVFFSFVFASDEVYVLYTEELPPYSTQSRGEISGLSVELVGELFTRSDLPYRFELLPWRRAYLKVKQEGRSCFFPFQRSQEREAEFHWISPLFISRIGFYRLRNSDIRLRTLADAQDYKISSYVGSDAVPYLSASDFNISSIVREEPNIQMLLNGRIDLWAVDTIVADYLLKKNNIDSVMLEFEFFSSLRALACNLSMPEGDINKLTNTLRQMYQDGTIDKQFSSRSPVSSN